MSTDWGYQAQQAAEKHLAACCEAMDAEMESTDPTTWPESPAYAPFCGCDTCQVREVLHIGWPYATAHCLDVLVQAGAISLEVARLTATEMGVPEQLRPAGNGRSGT